METRVGTVRRTPETGSGQRSRRPNGGQRSRSVEAGEQPGTKFRAAQCLLRLARDSKIDCRSIAQPAEPPGTDPYAGGCTRESWRQPTYVYAWRDGRYETRLDSSQQVKCCATGY